MTERLEPSGQGGPMDRRRDGAPIKRRCVAHRKDGGRCLRSANKGSTVCNSHGGAAGQVRRAAAERIAQEQARQACALYSVKIDCTPEEALAHELEVTAGAVRWLRGQITEHGAESAWWPLYAQERDYELALAKAMMHADVHGRLVAVAKRMAGEFNLVLRDVTDRLALTEVQRDLLPGAVEEALRLVVPPDGDDAA